MVRVLVTVEPKMYREAIALAVRTNRPGAEVMPVSADAIEGQADAFRPHVLVRNDSDAAVPERVQGGVVVHVEVLFRDSMAVRVATGDESYEIEDAGLEDLLALVDEAEGALSRRPGS